MDPHTGLQMQRLFRSVTHLGRPPQWCQQICHSLDTMNCLSETQALQGSRVRAGSVSSKRDQHQSIAAQPSAGTVVVQAEAGACTAAPESKPTNRRMRHHRTVGACRCVMPWSHGAMPCRCRASPLSTARASARCRALARAWQSQPAHSPEGTPHCGLVFPPNDSSSLQDEPRKGAHSCKSRCTERVRH